MVLKTRLPSSMSVFEHSRNMKKFKKNILRVFEIRHLDSRSTAHMKMWSGIA